MNNHTIAHSWVHQIEPSGSNANGSLYYNGDTIYSYGSHFPIARHINNVVLFTTNGYGTTTAKHKSLVGYAVNHKRIFYVPNVMANTKPEHKVNYNAIIKAYKKSLTLYARVRSNKQAHLNSAKDHLKDANEYTKLFKLGYRQKVFDITLSDELLTKFKKARIKELAKEKARAKQLLAENQEKILSWKAGNFDQRWLPHNLPVYLRVLDDNIESSKGVSFSIKHGKRAWRVINKCVKNKISWQANGHTIKLGHYNIDSIQSNGTVKAGCHTVPYSECLAIAKQLKWSK